MKCEIGAVAAVVALLLADTPAGAQTIFIDNARIHPVAGPDYSDVIEQGDIVVRNGRIAAVGRSLTAPDDAVVIDASGQVATPGFIAAWSQIGLVETYFDDEANDASPQGGFALSAALDARDAFNPASTLIPINRAGGITRALSAPAAGEKLFGGQAAFVDLSGDADSVVAAQIAQSVVLGYDGARRAGETRMGAWAELREYLDAANAYASDPAAFARRAVNHERFALTDVQALVSVAKGAQLLIVDVNGAAGIRNVIRFKEAYGLRIAIHGGAEAWVVAEELANAGIPVILDPMQNLPSQFESLRASLANAGRLDAAGVEIAFSAPVAHNLRLLPQSAGNAVANGLAYEAALVALTLAPARILGLEEQFGSIEEGKTADIVLWNGDPLELSSRPTAVLIDGQITSLENRQTLLRDRYRDLSRAALPFAYRGRE